MSLILFNGSDTPPNIIGSLLFEGVVTGDIGDYRPAVTIGSLLFEGATELREPRMDIDGSLLFVGVAEAENQFPEVHVNGSLLFRGRAYTEINKNVITGSLAFDCSMEAGNSVYQTTMAGSLKFVGSIDSTAHRPNELEGSLFFDGTITTKSDLACTLPSHSDLRWT